MKRWGRKAYFFVIDAIIGSAIIFFSLYTIMSSDIRHDTLQIDYEASEDYASFLITTRVQDINNEYINDLVQKNIITNSRNTLMDQIDQFYYNAYYICPPGPCRPNNLSYATNMLQNITEPLISNKYSISYTIIDVNNGLNTTIYERANIGVGNASIVVSSRKITFLQINSTVMFGPQVVEIKLWI